MLNAGADLRGDTGALGHVSLSTTQKYTHLNIDKLMEVYDNSHPKKQKKVNVISRWKHMVNHIQEAEKIKGGS